MRQKTKNHRNQGSIDKKIKFFWSPYTSHIQMGSLCAKNAIEKFSRLGTFNLTSCNYTIAAVIEYFIRSTVFLTVLGMVYVSIVDWILQVDLYCIALHWAEVLLLKCRAFINRVRKSSVCIWDLLTQGSEVLGYFEQLATPEQQGKRWKQ
jgi:hypothetical protein